MAEFITKSTFLAAFPNAAEIFGKKASIPEKITWAYIPDVLSSGLVTEQDVPPGLIETVKPIIENAVPWIDFEATPGLTFLGAIAEQGCENNNNPNHTPQKFKNY